ncbi:MAG: uracil-DNA glycosylase family protein [Gammaproteobacteria bacterium]|nr:uracil-DNA glycosylase family protein [Gammaproteobacteria bacterium]
MPEDNLIAQLSDHQKQLKSCKLCPQMHGPAVHGGPIVSPILLVGQAPGPREIEINRPFAWTAGKTLFSWFETIGLAENDFRHKVYMTAVCRCFPGKKINKGKVLAGDRVPSQKEIGICSQWISTEVELLKPKLIILVGKLAISQVLPVKKLTDVIGQSFNAEFHQWQTDFIPLPHPSGLSTWYRTEPGKTLLKQALNKIEKHQAWQHILEGE